MFERQSVDFNTISAPFTPDRSKLFCVAMVFICDVMEVTGTVTSLLK